MRRSVRGTPPALAVVALAAAVVLGLAWAPRAGAQAVDAQAGDAAAAVGARAVDALTVDARALDARALDDWVRTMMRRDALPGVALAIVQGGEATLARGYGSSGPGRPFTPETPTLLGSVSKSFTALAVMQLVERGELDLDAPVTRYLPWFRVAEPGFADRIRVRDLLQHSSGLTDLTFQEASHLRDDEGLEALGRALGQARPNAEPGTRFQYLNAGYDLLGLLIETASGEAYPAYLQRHVFGPLGMTRTSADPTAVAGLARGHALAFGLSWPARQALPRYGVPSGYVVSTASDMARYLRMLLAGGVLDGARVLEPDSVARLRRGTAAVPFYGMGWFVEAGETGRRVSHGGANEAYHADVVFYPDRGVGVVVLVNQDNLLSAFTAYPRLLEGVEALALGEVPPDPGWSVRWYGVALAASLLAMAALQFRAWRRRRRWAARARASAPWRRSAALLVGPVVASGAVVAVALGVRSWMGRGFSWRGLAMLPDVVIVAAAWVVSEAVVAVARAVAWRRVAREGGAPGRASGSAPGPGSGSASRSARAPTPTVPAGQDAPAAPLSRR